tara:strand:+ start:646 stop:1386 length:741 start_codon:yes stop_codon:yes gene_type:complete
MQLFTISIFALMLVGISSASPLLHVPEPREGLFQDPEEFARIGSDAEVSVGPRTFSEHFNTVQQHYLAIEGKHPPVYYFFCTVYYTPRESGFTAERGFDVTPEGRSSLGSRKFPKSFIRATIMEGFGRMETPTSRGSNYLKYDGRWGYGTRPLGNRNNTLIDRKSAAVHRSSRIFKKGIPLKVLDPQIYNCFGGSEFETADTGGGLFQSQIDLYWGEDDPLGPNNLFEPLSSNVAVRWVVPVIVGR